jgi:hypothetical protein
MILGNMQKSAPAVIGSSTIAATRHRRLGRREGIAIGVVAPQVGESSAVTASERFHSRR